MFFEISEAMRRGFRWMFDNYAEELFDFWPPYLGAGIQVDYISENFRRIDVRMPLTPYNKNYVGTQFGGSMYSMCDPFYMLMLLNNLEEEYVVWDKAAEIQFRKPGTGTVHATFELDEGKIDEIRRRVDEEGKIEPVFEVDIVDDSGDVVAEVTKTLHVHRKS